MYGTVEENRLWCKQQLASRANPKPQYYFVHIQKEFVSEIHIVMDTKTNPIEGWKTWANYCIITNLGEKNERYLVVLFLRAIGLDTWTFYNEFQFVSIEIKFILNMDICKFHQPFIEQMKKPMNSIFLTKETKKNVSHSILVWQYYETWVKTCNFCKYLPPKIAAIGKYVLVGNLNIQKRIQLSLLYWMKTWSLASGIDKWKD